MTNEVMLSVNVVCYANVVLCELALLSSSAYLNNYNLLKAALLYRIYAICTSMWCYLYKRDSICSQKLQREQM